MAQTSDPFQIGDTENGLGRYLVLKASWSPRFLDIIKREKITSIRLSDGWTDKSISFLESIPGLLEVSIICNRTINISPLFGMTQIRDLLLWCPTKGRGDFSQFKHLQRIGLQWSTAFESVFELQSLRDITITRFPHIDLSCW